jgi:hypothetical protein
MISNFSDVRGRLFAIGRVLPVASLWRTVECFAWPQQVIRVMMAIYIFKLLFRHS